MARGSVPVHSADGGHGVRGGDAKSVPPRPPPRRVGDGPGRGGAPAEKAEQGQQVC